MGWFTSSKSSTKSKKSSSKPKSKSKDKNKTKTKTKSSKSSKPSITDPPNVYRPALPPPPPPPQYPGNPPPPTRPTTAGPRPRPQPSQPQLLPPPNISIPYNHHYASHSQPHFQPAGYLAPPPGWNGYQQPVIVNQHYYLGTRPSQQTLSSSLNRFTGSMVNLAKEAVPTQLYDDGLSAWHGCTQLAQSTNALYERFNDIMTMIDHEKLCGNENNLFSCSPAPAPAPAQDNSIQDKGIGRRTRHKDKQSCNVAASVVSGNYFSKVELYANSKLPLDLPSLALHMPTWPLLCLAAQYSQRVYEKPRGSERDAHVSSDWLPGPRTTCIKSVSMDDLNTIVFAIRGTASFMDWAVNLNTAPVSPLRFLDDPGNLCHAGFLSVAKKMIRPVAARLRQLLQEDPSRSKYSLLITGHSAGGAIASLLYSHMVAQTSEAQSELNVLTNCFKRIHCVTFGAPPVSLLPLAKPDSPNLRKSIFLSFVNEGDPVVRADKAYVKSLLDLLSSPPPSQRRESKSCEQRSRSPSRSRKPRWKVPPCTLSNAGRLVVLRSGDPLAKPKDRKTVRERLDEGVVAVTCIEEQLRGAIWGDPVCHMMSLYAARIEVLAVRSVTGRGY
ncbi:hypothetical protein NW762_006613 [Fusarium torreyae]|uniref:Fungal lipase-type domain-containing protein n=1 Tax=Fusarium torreyae TaxID=1237075 RepID=A0A9W8VGZ9_9HYPO|nr:hypothetical protein NW762_006613 [Fusarium torreyae]